jgi:hypothetical protein
LETHEYSLAGEATLEQENRTPGREKGEFHKCRQTRQSNPGMNAEVFFSMNFSTRLI